MLVGGAGKVSEKKQRADQGSFADKRVDSTFYTLYAETKEGLLDKVDAYEAEQARRV